MRCARPPPPRTTRATVRFGSSLFPPVTSLAAALLTALVAEPASRSAGRQQTLLHEQEPPAVPGGSFTSYSNQPNPARVFFQRGSLVADDLLQAVAAGHHVSI